MNKLCAYFILSTIAPKRIIINDNETNKIGRNEVYPCGSGKKYKNAVWEKI